MAWTARTTAPDVSNKYYRHTGYLDDGVDGLNECMIIDRQTGFVMPNCVGYTWGRWYEALGQRPDLSRGDAGYWYSYPDGYERGRTPKVGAIACYSGGGYTGHVAVVEYFVGDTPITSNSGYNSTLFWLEGLVYDSATDAWNRPESGYTFQGFIYPPEIPEGLPAWMLQMLASRRYPNGRNRHLKLWR